MDLDAALHFVSENHRAVLVTRRRDGEPQLSPVIVTLDRDGRLVVSTRETAMKVHNIRRDPRVSVCVFDDGFFGPWVQVDGVAEVVPLPDALDGLVEYYRSVSGEHPDWDDYRDAMTREKRVLVRVDPRRAGPSVSG